MCCFTLMITCFTSLANVRHMRLRHLAQRMSHSISIWIQARPFRCNVVGKESLDLVAALDDLDLAFAHLILTLFCFRELEVFCSQMTEVYMTVECCHSRLKLSCGRLQSRRIMSGEGFDGGSFLLAGHGSTKRNVVLTEDRYSWRQAFGQKNRYIALQSPNCPIEASRPHV